MLGAITLVGACTWVKPIPQSQSVALLEKKSIVNCVKKGITQSKTLSKFLFIPRSQSKMSLELVTLAKNEATIMGGDVVVAETLIKEGGQRFGVYLCRND
jgi:hypothetical protein